MRRLRLPRWKVRHPEGDVLKPLTPSELLHNISHGQTHPDWRATDGRRFASVREAVWEGLWAIGAVPPREDDEAPDGCGWLVQAAGGRRLGPYGPASLLWHLCAGDVRADWTATRGAESLPVICALPERRPWAVPERVARQVRCPNCGALVGDNNVPCQYCGADLRSPDDLQTPDQPLVLQFSEAKCSRADCEGWITVPIDEVVERVYCLDCGTFHGCEVGRVCSVQSEVVWQTSTDTEGRKSSWPTDQKKWQIRYQRIGDEDVKLLTFQGPSDITIAMDEVFVALGEPIEGYVWHFQNLTLGRLWSCAGRTPPPPTGCAAPTAALCGIAAALAVLLR